MSPADDVSFLHRLDGEARQGLFVSTSRSRLRNTPFLDGRSRFWDRQTSAPLPVVGSGAVSPSIGYIFHVSFCGSTLLATLLDAPGAVLALKEPQVLVDAADWSNARPSRSASLSRLLHGIEDRLLHPAAPGERMVVKPSNWANTLIPHLCDPAAGRKAVFLSMGRYDFIKAVFRGGRDRIAYTARAAAHLTASSEALRGLLEEAISGSTDPLEQIGRMAGLAHRVQERVFVDAIERNGWNERHWITLDQLVGAPVETVLRAAAALDLPIEARDVEEAAGRRLARHSKSPDKLFSVDQRRAEDHDVEGHHRERLRRATDWSDSIAL